MLHFVFVRSSVFMVVCHLPSILWTTFALWIVFRKYRTRDQCATCSGPIPMIVVDGVFHPEEPDTLLVKMFPKLLITTTD